MKSPKYIILKQQLKDQIRRGDYKVGDRLPSENQLARDLKISRHTVLKGMAQLMAEGWIERFQGRGTFVAARGEGTCPTSRTVALICSDINNPLMMQIVAGMSGFLRDHKFELLILDVNRNTELEAEYLDSLEDRGLAGAFLWPHMPPCNRERVELLHKRGFPLVLLDRGYEGLSIPVVATENEAGAYEVTRHLIDQGHQRIAHITADLKNHFVEPVYAREAGFRKALKDAEIYLPDEFVQHVDLSVADQAAPGASVDGVLVYYEAMHRLLVMSNPPTAVFLLNDFLAPSCLKAITNQGLMVPEDIALAGFDNDLDADELRVSLTSYAQPGREIGKKAGELFTELAAGKVLDSFIYRIPGRLLIRQSTQSLKLAQVS